MTDDPKPNLSIEQEFQQVKSVFDKREKAESFVKLVPQLSSATQGEIGEDIWIVLNEWDSWARYLDTPSYANAIDVLVPYLSAARFPDLWKKIMAEKQSDDYERQYFAERHMVAIMHHTPSGLIVPYLSRIDLDKFKRPEMAAELYAIWGNELAQDEKQKIHRKAWEVALVSGDQPGVFRRIISILDQGVILEKWIENLQRLEHPNQLNGGSVLAYWEQLIELAQGIPEEYIMEACFDCCNSKAYGFHGYRRAGIIENLVHNLLDDKKVDAWKAIYSHLLHLEYIPLYRDPQSLAGELICRMPESLREGKWTEILTIARSQTGSVS